MTDYIIETKSLTKRFGSKIALNSLELAIPKGGIHALIGANGAGKSTLFRILLGLEAPTLGTTEILGANSRELTPEQRGKIGYVNEEHTLPTWMTADEVMEMQRNLYSGWRQDIFDNVLGNFDVQGHQKISGLSRGERAGLNLSMALAQSPDLLILDEPTLGLDVVAKQAFLEALMYTETDNNTTIIYCSHQMEEIERVAENLVIMEKGELKYMASPDEFLERIHYWICDFDGSAPANNEIPGLLTKKSIEGQYHLVVTDQDAAEFEAFLKQINAESIVRSPINLEKAVNSVLAQNHKAPKAEIA